MPRPRGVGDGTYDGILVVDKPVGPTSHDLVDLVRRLTGVRRVGHGGTLDPFAAGVLPVFVGRATRLVEYHMADDKQYRALIAFGASSTTDDLDGELTPSDAPAPAEADVAIALARFRGRIRQVPPDHSAVRVRGKRAYEVARSGERPALTARDVVVTRLELVGWDASDPSRPTATADIDCSAGTYIRAIARDLGAALGSGAYLVALTRTRSGPFERSAAHSPEAIRAAFTAGRGESLLLPADTGLDGFPIVRPGTDELQALLRGQVIRWRPSAAATQGAGTGLAPATPGDAATTPATPGDAATASGTSAAVATRAGHCRVRGPDDRLVAIARLEGGRLHPEKVLLDPAPRA